jgi:hypothetical protein
VGFARHISSFVVASSLDCQVLNVVVAGYGKGQIG